MKTTTVKISDALEMYTEINGLVSGDKVISKGLINEKLPIKIKYWLGRLSKVLEKQNEEVEELRIELIKKYGEKKDDDTFNIPYKIGEEINPNFEKFQKEYGDLLQEEIEIEHYSFSLESFENIETEGNLNQFFKLIEI